VIQGQAELFGPWYYQEPGLIEALNRQSVLVINDPARAREVALAKLQASPHLLRGARLQESSAKMAWIINHLPEQPGPVFIYSNYESLEGVNIMARVLEAHGFQAVTTGTTLPSDKAPRYIIYTGANSDTRDDLVNMFNDPRNARGEYIRVVLGTAAASEGLTFKCIRTIYIMEPHWTRVRLSQVIGRGRRLKSHDTLPVEERTLQVFLLVTEVDDSTDQYIDLVAQRKEKMALELGHQLKEVAIDCVINLGDNQLPGAPPIHCLEFSSGVKGALFGRQTQGPDIASQHFIPYRVHTSHPKLQAMLFKGNQQPRFLIRAKEPTEMRRVQGQLLAVTILYESIEGITQPTYFIYIDGPKVKFGPVKSLEG
jgi:hypothetical protein